MQEEGIQIPLRHTRILQDQGQSGKEEAGKKYVNCLKGKLTSQ